MLPTHPPSPQTKPYNQLIKSPLSPSRLQLVAAGPSRCSCRSTTANAGPAGQNEGMECQSCHKHLPVAASGLAALMLLNPGPVLADQVSAVAQEPQQQAVSILLPAGSLAANLSAPEAPALVSSSSAGLLEGVKGIVEAGMQDLATNSMTAVGGPVTGEVLSASANQAVDPGAAEEASQQLSLSTPEAAQQANSSDTTSAPVLAQQQQQAQEQQTQHKPRRGLWCSAWQAYCDALERSPLSTKVYTGAVGTLLGDLVAQVLSHASKQQQDEQDMPPSAFSKGSGFQFDAMRTGRLCLYSAAIGTPMSHAWYGLLEASVLPSTPLAPAAVAAKVALDQLCQTPFGMALFFAVMKVLEGRPQEVQQELQSKMVPALLANWKLWPAAQLINFTLIPEQQRILYINIVGIVWTVIISNMQQASTAGDTATDPSSSNPAAPAVAAARRRSSSAGAETDPRMNETPAGLGFALRRRSSAPA